MKIKQGSKDEAREKRPPFYSKQVLLTSKTSEHTELWTIYKTKDLGEAASLVTAHCRLIKLEPEQGFFWFMFDDPATCRKTSDAYWNNELVVRAKDLMDSVRSLKERLFAEKSKENKG